MTQATSGAGDSVPHVLFDGVSKRYGDTQAIRRLDLALCRGEFLSLLGPSGSGKTTALMLLAGFETPDSGRILLNGRRIDTVPANRRNLGVVFQSYALFPHMSVAANLAYPLKARGFARSEIAARVTEALDMVQLSGLEDRYPAQLSGGQQQRVALARALIFRPDLLLLDEPLGALDRQLREELQAGLKALHARLGLTFLYVTHDQDEALALSDRIAVFAGGAVQQTGTPAEIYLEPRTAFVAGFLGENNSLSGEVHSVDEGLLVRLSCGSVIAVASAIPLARGAKVQVLIRPEQLRLNQGGLPDGSEAGAVPPAAAASPAPGRCLPARFSALQFGGDHVKLLAQSLDGRPLTVKLPAGRDAVREAAGLVAGEPLWLSWSPGAARAYPAG